MWRGVVCHMGRWAGKRPFLTPCYTFFMTKLDLHYAEPRLVDLYDIENPRGADTDFYVQLAAELDAHHILDLGCGTGLFTRELAAVNGRTVVGVDPAKAPCWPMPDCQPGRRARTVGGRYIQNAGHTTG